MGGNRPRLTTLGEFKQPFVFQNRVDNFSSMPELLTFILAIFSTWLGLIGAVAIVAAVIQFLVKKYFRPGVWVAVGVVLLFIAAYQTWREQRASYMTEKCRVEKFQDRSAAKKKLALFIKGADELIHSDLAKDSSAEEVKAWFSRADDWENDVYIWTRDNLGEPAATKVIDTTKCANDDLAE